MATLYENYNPGGTQGLVGGTTFWRCQTFTPTIGHSLTSVRLRMRRTSGSGGTVTVSIRVTDGDGKPTGSDLAVSIYDADLLGTIDWHELFFTSFKLAVGTKYGLVWRTNAANVSLEVDTSAATYTGGSYGDDNADNGATWTMVTDDDWVFEEYGIASSGYLWGEGKNLHLIDEGVIERVYAPTNNLVTVEGLVVSDKGNVVYN
ncbi:hypothetical protein LCGC14_1569750 [marine sediment metagenome]|uniref:Uncharacterized protein n=1 Tax=marine sediment metagenome TaxID=412755 RepID=A0A0F9L145_9ZZZZ